MDEQKKKRASSKTLQAAREAGYFGKKMLGGARAAVEENRPVAWAMLNWWLGGAIAKAMDVEIVYPENYSAFCAAAQAIEPNLEYAESDGFPASLCGYARNCFGYTRKLKENNFIIPAGVPGGGMPRPSFLLACGAGCDARYKWFQALGRYMDVPVWVLELPQTGAREYYIPGNKEDNINFMIKELRAFVVFLEKLLGKKMSWDKLDEYLDTSLKTMNLAHKVDILRKSKPSPMLSTDFWAVMTPHLFLSEDPESLEFYKKVYAEVKNKVDNNIGAIPEEKYRMIFAELPPWHSLGFFGEIAIKHGIAFVVESWGYHVPPPLPEEEREKAKDPLELIARFTYHKFSDAAQLAQELNIDPVFRIPSYLGYARDYQVDGMMCHPLLSCRPMTYHLLYLSNVLLDKFKVPSVFVEGDIVDRRAFNEAEAFNKLEAFLETMDHYREVRKKLGFGW